MYTLCTSIYLVAIQRGYEPHPHLWSLVVLAELGLREGSNVVSHLLPRCNGQLHQPLGVEPGCHAQCNGSIITSAGQACRRYLNDWVDVDEVQPLDLVGLQAVRTLHARQDCHYLLSQSTTRRVREEEGGRVREAEGGRVREEDKGRVREAEGGRWWGVKRILLHKHMFAHNPIQEMNTSALFARLYGSHLTCFITTLSHPPPLTLPHHHPLTPHNATPSPPTPHIITPSSLTAHIATPSPHPSHRSPHHHPLLLASPHHHPPSLTSSHHHPSLLTSSVRWWSSPGTAGPHPHRSCWPADTRSCPPLSCQTGTTL